MTEEPENTIPTCPRAIFYIADVVLLAIAVGLAFFSDNGLNAQNVSIVSMLVIFAFLAFVAPEFIDAFLLNKHFHKQVEDTMALFSSRMDILEKLIKEEKDRSYDINLAAEDIAGLRKHLDEMASELQLSQKLTTSIKALETRLDNEDFGRRIFEKNIKDLNQLQLTEVQKKISELEITILEIKTAASEEIAEPNLPEKGDMIKRALSSADNLSSGSALQRILTTKQKKEKKGKPEEAVASQKPLVEDSTLTETLADVSKKKENQEEVSTKAENPPSVEDPFFNLSDKDQQDIETPELIQESKRLRSSRKRETILPTPEEIAKKKEELFGKDTLFNVDDISSVKGEKKGRRNAKSGLLLQWMIGFGNKPYLRGNGAGLSQEKGVAMTFVEIGKWKWDFPEDATEPLVITLWKNDEEKVEAFGEVTLSPGEFLEVKATL